MSDSLIFAEGVVDVDNVPVKNWKVLIIDD
jgi:hypothetical protein